jgi:hypothetical protein
MDVAKIGLQHGFPGNAQWVEFLAGPEFGNIVDRNDPRWFEFWSKTYDQVTNAIAAPHLSDSRQLEPTYFF